MERITLLLVEDNDGDVDLMRIALEEIRMPVDIHTARDGLEALELLTPSDPQTPALKPQVILLDLNMPRMNGAELLAVLRRKEATKDIPVLIFTSSDAPYDMRSGYRLQANCYITKPGTLDAFISLAQKIEMFWLNFTTPPEKTAA